MRHVKPALALFVTSLLSAWSGAKAMLDWIGRVGAFQDASDTNGATFKALNWLFATPWWMPGIIAACVAIGVLWILAPKTNNVPSPPQERPRFEPGKGGSVRIRGNRTRAEGGNAGFIQSHLSGSGGDVDIEGDDSFGKGGDGGNRGTADGRGGRRTLSAGERLGMPTAFWPIGYGGSGVNTPEYNRRLALLITFRREYFQAFPDDAVFIEAGVDPVPERWMNARLLESGEQWRVEMDRGGYKML